MSQTSRGPVRQGPGSPSTAPTRGQDPRASRPPWLAEDAVGASDYRHRRPETAAVYRRRRVVAGLLLAAVVGVLLVLLAFVWPGFARGDDPAPPVTEPTSVVTVTEAPATPTIEPVERTTDTTFSRVLPDEVLQYALVSEQETDALDGASSGADPIEAYELVYADGEGADARTVRLLAGQWASAEEARAAAEALVAAAGAPTSTGDVLVDDETVGTYTITPGESGLTTITWYNSTAVLQATGPSGDIDNIYNVFPI